MMIVFNNEPMRFQGDDQRWLFSVCRVRTIPFPTSQRPASAQLDVRLQVEVKDQNMVKHPAGIYHRKYTTQRNSSWDLHTVSKSYGKFPRDACPCFDP